MEAWLPVTGFEGRYEVSDDGRVRSLPKSVPTYRGGVRHQALRFLTPQINTGGYRHVTLFSEGRRRLFLVHRLVLTAFVGHCPAGLECCHGDGDKQNNRLTNLRWGTKKENAADSVAHATSPRGERSSNARVTAADVHEMRDLRRETRLTYKQIGERFGIGSSGAFLAINRYTWRHL